MQDALLLLTGHGEPAAFREDLVAVRPDARGDGDLLIEASAGTGRGSATAGEIPDPENIKAPIRGMLSS
ncbi:hypothetical protein J2S53_003677 [Actinopolyspora lacussalsi]|nr:hypothetical protein [Actinopolyspora lacussalsi]